MLRRLRALDGYRVGVSSGSSFAGFVRGLEDFSLADRIRALVEKMEKAVEGHSDLSRVGLHRVDMCLLARRRGLGQG